MNTNETVQHQRVGYLHRSIDRSICDSDHSCSLLICSGLVATTVHHHHHHQWCSASSSSLVACRERIAFSCSAVTSSQFQFRLLQRVITWVLSIGLPGETLTMMSHAGGQLRLWRSLYVAHNVLMAWYSGRTSVCDRRTFPVLHSTCSGQVTTYVGKPSALQGQPTRPTEPFIIWRSINE